MFFTSIHLTKCQLPLTFVRNLSRKRNIKKIKKILQKSSTYNYNNNILNDFYKNIKFDDIKNKTTYSIKYCSRFVKIFITSLITDLSKPINTSTLNNTKKITKTTYNVSKSYKFNKNKKVDICDYCYDKYNNKNIIHRFFNFIKVSIIFIGNLIIIITGMCIGHKITIYIMECIYNVV